MNRGRMAPSLVASLFAFAFALAGVVTPGAGPFLGWSGASAQATSGPLHPNPHDLVPASALPDGWHQFGTAIALTPDAAGESTVLYTLCEPLRTIAGTPIKATAVDFGVPSTSGGLPSVTLEERVLRYATSWNATAEYKVYTDGRAPQCLGTIAKLEAEAFAAGRSRTTPTTPATPSTPGSGTSASAKSGVSPPATVTDKFDRSLTGVPDSVGTTARVHITAGSAEATTFTADVVVVQRGDEVAVFTFFCATVLLAAKVVRLVVREGVARLP